MLARIASEQDTETVPLHASIGVALANGGDADAVLRRADAALYLAKREGRNRVVVSDP
jgi:diguanylate cyclase (GGDEF)-like protein